MLEHESGPTPSEGRFYLNRSTSGKELPYTFNQNQERLPHPTPSPGGFISVQLSSSGGDEVLPEAADVVPEPLQGFSASITEETI